MAAAIVGTRTTASTGPKQRLRDLLKVGVGHDDQVVFGSAEGLYAFAGGGTLQVNISGDRCRADKAHRSDIRMVQERIHRRLLIPVHYVEYAVRQAGVLQKPRQANCRRRAAFTSTAVASGTRAATTPVVGLKTSPARERMSATVRPPIQCGTSGCEGLFNVM
jgi:hypothetical protein